MRPNSLPDTVLSQLFDDLLVVARSFDPPSFDCDRTCALAASTFATIQLPATLLSPHQGAIVAWMSELAVHMSPKNKNAKVCLNSYQLHIFVHRASDHPPSLVRVPFHMPPRYCGRVAEDILSARLF